MGSCVCVSKIAMNVYKTHVIHWLIALILKDRFNAYAELVTRVMDSVVWVCRL
jgi:hypothetical protein